jgi:PAS domain S-box-containing protein
VSAVTRENARIEFDLVREAFDRTAVGLVVITPEGVFRQVNRAFCELLGYACEELEGQSFRRVTHPDDIARDDEHLRLIRSGSDIPASIDKRFIRKDGSEVWVRRNAAVMREPGGEARYIVAFVDLTEQRTKDSALQHAAAELESHLHFTRALLDAIPNPVYFKDREGRYQAYNRAWGELFGSGVDWVGKTATDLLDTSLAALHLERDRSLLERPSSTTYEALVPNAEGEKRQMLYNKVSFVDQRGEVAGLIGVITDVTHYKETERALEASEARFRVLTESSLDLISVIAEDGRILYQSAALRSLVGYDPADTIGKDAFAMIHRDDVDHVRAAFRRIVETHQ